MELVQGLDGGEVVDVDGEDLVADLGQHGVVKLEDGQLVARAARCHVAQVLGQGRVVAAVGLELLKDLICSLDDAGRHAG